MPAYAPPVDQLLPLGEPEITEDWANYAEMGFSAADVPELIRLMSDTELFLKQPLSDATWGMVHAWRVLARLGAVEAVGPYLELMGSYALEEAEADDWVREEAPLFFRFIGPAAVPQLLAFLADSSRGDYPRWGVAETLVGLVREHPELRPEVVAALTRELVNAPDDSWELASGMVSCLLDLKAVEAASEIEDAFDAGKVDESMVGDWDEVQYELGLRAEPPPPKRHAPLADFGRMPPLPGGARNPAARAKERAKAKRKATKQARKKNRKKKR